MKSGRQYSLRSALVHGLLFVLALYFLVPLYVMVVASFKSLDEIIHSSIIALPIVWTTAGWENMVISLHRPGLHRNQTLFL